MDASYCLCVLLFGKQIHEPISLQGDTFLWFYPVFLSSCSVMLSRCASRGQIELLTILLGRVLQVQKANESGHDVEREIQETVQIIQPIFTSTRNDEISGIVLDILSYLPARSANEIEYVLQLINDATDERIQIACASALRYASPGTPEAWTALEVGRQSKVEVVRKAVGEGLERRR